MKVREPKKNQAENDRKSEKLNKVDKCSRKKRDGTKMREKEV